MHREWVIYSQVTSWSLEDRAAHKREPRRRREGWPAVHGRSAHCGPLPNLRHGETRQRI